MTKSKAWMIASFALLLAGCQTNAPASVCDGWQKLSPSSDTRSLIIANDRPFAEQVAAHNTFGQQRNCW